MRKSIFILLFALLNILSVQADGFGEGGIFYEIISGTNQVMVTCRPIEMPRYSGSIDIPSTVGWDGTTYIVTAIGNYAFRDCSNLTSVTIPNSVTSIGGWTFGNCSNLTSVTIPNSVTSIGNSAFSGCSSLTSVTIPEGVTSIREGTFSYCSGLISVTIPESVTSIGYYAFSGCSSLTSVTIPEGVPSIGREAFSGCSSLTSVTIPESLTSSGYAAFKGCTSIATPLYNSKIFVCMPQKYSGEYVVPSGIQSIAVTAFQDCSGLTSVTIPEGVVEIGYWGFNGCSGLKSIVLPASLDTIGYNAFGGCCNCESVTCFAENPPFCSDGDYGFYFCIQNNLYVPRDSKAAYKRAPIWKHFDNIEAVDLVITVQANDTSMGTVSGGGTYAFGTEVTLKAISNEGYHFEKWDDGSTDNPRVLTVTEDITLTAIFANGKTPNEAFEADNFRVYAQDRTIHLSENSGLVQVYNMAGQCIYNGHATAIPVPQSGVYIVAVGSQRFKVLVR